MNEALRYQEPKDVNSCSQCPTYVVQCCKPLTCDWPISQGCLNHTCVCNLRVCLIPWCNSVSCVIDESVWPESSSDKGLGEILMDIWDFCDVNRGKCKAKAIRQIPNPGPGFYNSYCLVYFSQGHFKPEERFPPSLPSSSYLYVISKHPYVDCKISTACRVCFCN